MYTRRYFPGASETARDNCEFFQFPYAVRCCSDGWRAERLEQRDMPIGLVKVALRPGECGVVWYPPGNWVVTGGLFYGGKEACSNQG